MTDTQEREIHDRRRNERHQLDELARSVSLAVEHHLDWERWPSSPPRPTSAPRPETEAERVTGTAHDRALGVRAAGRTLGDYIIREIAGFGPTWTVYAARAQRPGGRLVAAKVLRSPTTLDAEDRRRLLATASLVDRLGHPNIVPVHDVHTINGAFVCVTDWIDGPSLQDVIVSIDALGRPTDAATLWRRLGIRADDPDLPLDDAIVGFGIETAHALAAIHRAGMVHGSVRPSNVLIRRDGTALLTDFGFVRLPEPEPWIRRHREPPRTYAAPEQRLETPGPLGPRADIYALAATLHHVRHGQPPTDEPSTSSGIDAVLHRALADDPDARYPDAGAFADALSGALGERRRDPAPVPEIVSRTTPKPSPAPAAESKPPMVAESPAAPMRESMREPMREDPAPRPLAPPAPPPPVAAPEPARVRTNETDEAGRELPVGLLAALAGVLVIASLALMVGAILRQTTKLETAESETVRAAELSLEMLGAIDPDTLGDGHPLAALLDELRPKLDDLGTTEGRLEPTLQLDFGRAYRRLGRLADAGASVERAHTLALERFGADDPLTVSTLTERAHIAANLGHHEAAEEMFRAALAVDTERPEEERLLARSGLGAVIIARGGETGEAAGLIEPAFEALKASRGDLDPATLHVMGQLAALRAEQGRYTDAEAWYRRRGELARQRRGDDHAALCEPLEEFGRFLRTRNKFDDARDQLEQAATLRRRYFGPKDVTTLRTRRDLAATRLDLGESDDAETMLREIIDDEVNVLGPSAPDTLATMDVLARCLVVQDRIEDARALLETIIERAPAVFEPSDRRFAVFNARYGACLARQGEYKEAEFALLSAYDTITKGYGERDPELGWIVRTIINLYDSWGRTDRADAWRSHHAEEVEAP